MCRQTIDRPKKNAPVKAKASLAKVIEIQKKLPFDRQLAALLRYKALTDADTITRAQQLVSICLSIVAEDERERAFTQIALNQVSFDLAQTCKQTSNATILSELKNN